MLQVDCTFVVVFVMLIDQRAIDAANYDILRAKGHDLNRFLADITAKRIQCIAAFVQL